MIGLQKWAIRSAVIFSLIGVTSLVLLLGVTTGAVGADVHVCRSSSGIVKRQNDAIEIDGFLDESLERCFRRLFTNKIRIIDIRSSGGTPEGALSIAERISTARPTIRIQDYCASACAYLILPAASNLEATENSIVLFHHTATSTYDSLGDQALESSTRFKSLSARELALYAKLGVSPWLLRAPFLAQEPVCEVTGLKKDGKPSADYKARFKAVLIDRAALARVGLKIPTSVVGGLPELVEVASRLPDRGASLLAGGITTLSSADVADSPQLARLRENRLPVLPTC